MRATIFKKAEDFAAFERILAEGLQLYDVQLYSYQLMPTHFHLVLSPQVDGEMSRFMGWVGGTHTMRYHAHYHTGGMGHVYQQRYKSFPIQDDEHFLVVCRYVERVNEPLGEKELEAVRRCAQRGSPLGEETWVESIARRLNLDPKKEA